MRPPSLNNVNGLPPKINIRGFGIKHGRDPSGKTYKRLNMVLMVAYNRLWADTIFEAFDNGRKLGPGSRLLTTRERSIEDLARLRKKTLLLR